ncbi:hypothetical protein [Marinobacter salarius]|uniref:hypothetical protein n=1 Tax=Marinobacter salarius TaxID=1420917 RepID=UPI003BA940E5
MTKPKKIYDNQILIGELADAESLTLTSSLDYAKTLDEKGPVVSSDEMSLQELFKFYRESFPALKLTVATSANEEALEALEAGGSVMFDGGDHIDVRGKDGKQMALAKLRFASVDNITEYSRKAIRELLTDYPFIREPDAVTAVCDASPLADPAMLTGYADWFIRTIRERVLSTVKINDDANSYTFTGECGDDNQALVRTILSRGGNYIHKGSQGSGKSELARAIVGAVTENERFKAVIITHRRTIADSCMSGVEGVVHYEHVEPGAELNMRALVICANSIIRPNLEAFLRKVDVVIVEEAAQTLRHIASGTVNRRGEVLCKLNGLISKAHANLLLDADSNTRVLKLIRDNKPDDAVVNILEKPVDFSKITVELNRYEQAEGMIENMMTSGPVAIATDSKRKVDRLSAKIRKEFPDSKRLSVHSDNVLGKVQSAFIQTPNDEASEIDALIYSPAITSSVSITNPRFQSHVGLFSGVVTATDAVQMLRRNRPCTHFTVGVRNSGRYLPDTAEQILAGASSVNDFDRWAAEIEADDNFVRNHFQAAIYIIAKHYGFNVVIADEKKEVIDNGKSWELSGMRLESHQAEQSLLNAHAAGHKAVEKRNENAGETNESNALGIERARLERTVGKSEITEDDVKAWGRGVLSAHVKNLEIVRSCKKEADELDKKDTKSTAFRDKRRIGEHRSVFRMVFEDLDLNPFTGEGEYTVSEANALLEKLQSNLSHFNSLGLKTKVGKAKVISGTRTVNMLIGEFGFNVISKESNSKNGRQRKYSICPKSWARMTEYLSNRARKHMSLVKPEFTDAEEIKPTLIEVKPISHEELYGKVAEMSVESRVSIKHDAWKKAQDFFKPVALQGINSLEAIASLGTDATSLSDSISSKFFEGRKITFRQSKITKVDALGTVYATLFELPEAAKQQLAKDISGQYEEDQLIPF